MSFYDRDYDSRLSSDNKINPLVILIAISMIVFVTLAFFKALVYLRLGENGNISDYFESNILKWFAFSGDLNTFIKKPWIIITHAFVHVGIWSLLGNMLWLWAFGYVITDITGTRKIVPLYLYGAIAGAAAYLLCCNLLSQQGGSLQFFGAGAAVMTIALAATTISPGYRIFPMLGGGIPLWFVTLLYALIDLSTIPSNNPAIHIAHVAGGLSGVLVIFLLRKGYDLTQWMISLYDWFINLFNPDKPLRKPDFKKTLFYNATHEPFIKINTVTQQKIDEILDKISREGVENLSQAEKDFLERASREEINGK